MKAHYKRRGDPLLAGRVKLQRIRMCVLLSGEIAQNQVNLVPITTKAISSKDAVFDLERCRFVEREADYRR